VHFYKNSEFDKNLKLESVETELSERYKQRTISGGRAVKEYIHRKMS